MKITYLCYCPRSGSTKFADLLTADSAFVLPEFRSAIWLLQRFDADTQLRAGDVSSTLLSDPQLSDNLKLTDSDISAVVDRSKGKTPIDTVKEIVTQWAEKNGSAQPKSALIKAGRAVEVIEQSFRIDQSLQLLFLVRDPRAVVRSMTYSSAPRDRSGSTFARGSMSYAIRMWRRRLGAAMTIGKDFPGRVLTVRFEDLENSEAITDAARFIGTTNDAPRLIIADAEKGLHQNVYKEFDAGRNQQWQDQLSSRSVRHIEFSCREEMARLGYPATKTSVSAGAILQSKLVDLASTPISTLHRARSSAMGRTR